MPISNPIRIYPNDLKPSVGIGVDIPFNKPGVFTSNYQTKDAIRNNLLNFFLTNLGERYMNPEFGGGLRSFLFEQIEEGNIDFLEDRVQDKLNTKFPDVIVEQLDVEGDEENQSLTVFLQYSVADTNIMDEINIDYNI